MGIKHLNIFLKDNCPEAISCISIADLTGKKIAIDISIYLYKYIGEDNLIENIYLMISMFRYYNIIPIFIFDGKPPAEKRDLLIQRRKDKIYAENEYNRLKKQLDSISINVNVNVNVNEDELEKQEIISNMDSLKKRFIYVSKNQIEKVKELITSYGVTYYDAPGEADELCAMLVIKKKVWGCMSEDMDLFAYGCPRVLRYFSLINRTVVVYTMKHILNKLDITQKEFRQICILSGTDYNSNNKNECDLKKTIKLFKKYKKSKEMGDFYEWIYNKFPEHIDDLDLLQNTYNMFDLSDNHIHLKNCDNISIVNRPIMKEKMYSILEEDGFVFGNYTCD